MERPKLDPVTVAVKACVASAGRLSSFFGKWLLRWPIAVVKLVGAVLPLGRRHNQRFTRGAGGMGEVYRARDTRLERPVPSRFSPRVFSPMWFASSASTAGTWHELSSTVG